tara:strand:+ start:245 stop:1345 length:1101 start_codon:yes stop_codon:yes gene_type:complete
MMKKNLKTKIDKIKKDLLKESNFIMENEVLNNLLNKPIQIRKPRIKIDESEFNILNYKEYENILNINYNLNQLKSIAKHYRQKLTGNKDELKKRLYNYLFYSFNVIKIQKITRTYFIKKYIKLHGPGFLNKDLCTNDKDFCTLDNIKEIPYNQFFSFKDSDDFIYAFDIYSLYNLYVKNKSSIENPFSTKPIHKDILNNLKKFIKLSKLLKIDIKINFEELEITDEIQRIDMKILTLFQEMDSLGNYTSISWFNNLNKMELIIFLKELIDIWEYRANLSILIKRQICPPFGNPFRKLNININNIHSYNTITIKKNILYVLEELITKGIDNDSKSLGSYYILSALTLVSNDAAESMPWLYESVNYNN